MSPAPPPGDRPASPAHSLADILRVQLFPARLALETAQMPVFLQGHQGLAVFDLHSAALATWKTEWSTAVILVGVGERRRVTALHRWDFRHPRGSESGPGDGTDGTVQRGRYTTARVSARRAPTACSLGRAPGILA